MKGFAYLSDDSDQIASDRQSRDMGSGPAAESKKAGGAFASVSRGLEALRRSIGLAPKAGSLSRSMDDLPVSLSAARSVTRFMKANFGLAIESAVKGSPFITPPLLAAIACQETAYVFAAWIGTHDCDTILARCVLDASGDVNHDRSEWPRNTPAFRETFDKADPAFAPMLIEEGNKTRQLRGYRPWQNVYAGYGLFQYDIQYAKVPSKAAFFKEKKWYNIDDCITNVVGELNEKYRAKGELWAAVKAYNGSGPRAERYKLNVQKFFAACQDEWAKPDTPLGGKGPSSDAPAPAQATS